MKQTATSQLTFSRWPQVIVGLAALLGFGSLTTSPPAEAGPLPPVPAVQTITLPPGQTTSPSGQTKTTDLSKKMTVAKPLSDTDDRTLSPYFYVPGEDSSTDRLPLKSTSADVAIAGVIADVTVTQVYTNNGAHPIEAIYVFPGSTRAAVYGMKMTIGERTIVAEIQKREEARKTYETAKAQGKSASLLEQQRPNVFQMNVANIMPGDEIHVELRYTELLVPTDGIYEFVYPTVVGPRYSNTAAQGAPDTEKWVENPYLHQGQAPTYTFDFTATLDAGMPIQEMAVPTHQVHVQYESASRAVVSLDQSEASGGNRDVILRYRLAGNRVQSGLLLYHGEKENFFLLMNQPPARVEPDEIVPREYVFIMDVSGSMSGFPLDISKKLMKDLIGRLSPQERFNVILFAGRSATMAPQSIPATSENISKAIRVIDNQRGGGGTELLPALKRAFDMPSPVGFSRSIVVVTDGYVSVEPQAFDLIRKRLGDANLFAFGIGSSVNRHLIEGMARVGLGEPLIITKPGEAAAQAEKFRRYIQSPVLTNVVVDFGGFDVYDVEPQSIPDVLAERPVVVFGKWRGQPRGTITVRGIAGRSQYEQTFDVADYQPMETNSALQYLWARHRIATLGDYNLLQQTDERVKEITGLGLTYHLLTAYTSFVAVDSLVRANGDEAETVVQPLPLPEGVSDAAVGSVAGVLGAQSYGGGGYGGAVRAKRSMSLAVRSRPMAANEAQAVRSVGPSAPAPSVNAEATVDMVAQPSTKTKKYAERKDASEPLTEKKEAESSDDKEAGPTVEIDTLHVDGALTTSAVRTYLEAHLASLQACYTNALVRTSGIQGHLVVTFTVGADGKITAVTVDHHDDALNDTSMLACWTTRIQRWMFPAGSGETTVHIVWKLEP